MAVSAVLLAAVLMVAGAASGQPPAAGARVAVVSFLPDATVGAHVRGGLHRAAAELRGLDASFVDLSTASGDAGSVLADLAGRHDAVVLIGVDRRGLLDELVRTHPSTRFITIDGHFTVAAGAPNLRQLTFRDEQAGFLAGASAAMTTRTGVVGFIGASSLVRGDSLQIGYAAGARYISPSVRVLVDYVGVDLEVSRSAAKWAQVARAQYQLGADVVFAAGAPALEGLLRSAEAAGGWVVGLGSPTSHRLVPETSRRRLLAMIVKDYERAVLETLRLVSVGRFAPGSSWYGVPDGIAVLPPVPPRLGRILELIASTAIAVPGDGRSLERFLRTPPPRP